MSDASYVPIRPHPNNNLSPSDAPLYTPAPSAKAPRARPSVISCERAPSRPATPSSAAAPVADQNDEASFDELLSAFAQMPLGEDKNEVAEACPICADMQSAAVRCACVLCVARVVF